MKKKSSAPTMKDVAREAGVALGTVSKVVNGLPVGEEYRIKVEEAIEKLHYHVNSYARGLKADRTYTIALIMPNIRHPYFAELTHQISLELQKRDYKMILCTTEYDPEIEQRLIRMVQQNKVDGIIGLTYDSNLEINEDIPFVTIDRILSPYIPCVCSDNFQGGQMAAEKLYELGCRNTAFMRIGSALKNEPNKRKAGFVNGCLSTGMNYTLKTIDETEDYTIFGNFLNEHIHDGKLDFDGIFCVTDRLACDTIDFLKRKNIKVPEDVQIIGFDGIRSFGNGSYCCSTIVQPTQSIAEMCVNILLQDKHVIKPPLVCLPVTYAPGGTTKDSIVYPEEPAFKNGLN